MIDKDFIVIKEGVIVYRIKNSVVCGVKFGNILYLKSI